MTDKSLGTFINPFTDFGFKKIFGSEESKPLLISFLNDLLPIKNKKPRFPDEENGAFYAECYCTIKCSG